MARWPASAKWAAGPALAGQRAMPLALRLSEGLGRTRRTLRVPFEFSLQGLPRATTLARCAWKEIVMTVPKSVEAAILEMYDNEKPCVAAISKILNINRSVVHRVLGLAGVLYFPRKARNRKIDAHLSLVEESLVRFPAIESSRLFAICQEQGYVGSQSQFRHLIATIRIKSAGKKFDRVKDMRRWQWAQWLYLLERRQLPRLDAAEEKVRQELFNILARPTGFERQKALVILGYQQLFSPVTIAECMNISSNTVNGYLSKYLIGGVSKLFERHRKPKKCDDESIKAAIFSLLHEPPSLSNINRTSWRQDDLRRILLSRGFTVGKDAIRAIIRKAGYKWRSAKTVLTSNDPEYREKLEKLRLTLAMIGPNERFFSIDEFGPFAIKLIGGRVLSAPGEWPTVPQWQRSKGSLIVTAALELQMNQIVHFYSDAKNTEEMIRMAELLVDNYQDCKTLYLSWDAASWHISKALGKFIAEHNEICGVAELPRLETVPLPAGAQFLNVIESVFSGMARAIIHNSNYSSKSEAKSAVDRYFYERNQHFEAHPQRAGNKIWRKERVVSAFDASNNCKDPAYR